MREIENLAKKMRKRRLFTWVFRNKSDLDKIKAYQEKLRQSLYIFQLKSHISIEDSTARLEERLRKLLEQQKQREEVQFQGNSPLRRLGKTEPELNRDSENLDRERERFEMERRELEILLEKERLYAERDHRQDLSKSSMQILPDDEFRCDSAFKPLYLSQPPAESSKRFGRNSSISTCGGKDTTNNVYGPNSIVREDGFL